MTFLYKRGANARRRVMHVATYDRLGNVLAIPLCGDTRLRLDTTCNLPLGQPICRRCDQAVKGES